MKKNDLEKELKEIVVKNSKIDVSKTDIKAESDLVRDFAFNSLAIIALVVNIEEKFGIELDDDMLAGDLLSNYGKLESYLKERISNDGAK